ncbi:MAG: hypothetical protein K0S35_3560, partial [Geminicoccaceae bacterium]|nr:hypothetical protein [Geminicoccaceae bacterium]
MPTPTAPLNTANAVRSIPTLPSAATTAIVTSTILRSLVNSTWTEGVRLGALLIRLSSRR